MQGQYAHSAMQWGYTYICHQISFLVGDVVSTSTTGPVGLEHRYLKNARRSAFRNFLRPFMTRDRDVLFFIFFEFSFIASSSTSDQTKYVASSMSFFALELLTIVHACSQ